MDFERDDDGGISTDDCSVVFMNQTPEFYLQILEKAEVAWKAGGGEFVHNHGGKTYRFSVAVYDNGESFDCTGREVEGDVWPPEANGDYCHDFEIAGSLTADDLAQLRAAIQETV